VRTLLDPAPFEARRDSIVNLGVFFHGHDVDSDVTKVDAAENGAGGMSQDEEDEDP